MIWIRVVALATVLLLSSMAVANAQSSQGVLWQRYDVDIELLQDSTFVVTETQQIQFGGTFRKGFREIPLDRVNGITEVTVSENGQQYTRGSDTPGTYSVGRDDQKLRVDWWFTPVTNGTRTFTLKYRVSGGLRVYPGGDQLYWKAIYGDRAGPVTAGTVTVRLPFDVAASDGHVAGYPANAVSSARFTDARTAVVTTANLSARDELEARVQFPHGLINATPAAWQQSADRSDWYNENTRPIINIVGLLLGVAVPVFGGLWLLLGWFTSGRDPRVKEIEGTLREPPSNLAPGLVGTLVDERADVQDVVATLVDLGNRNLISIAPVPPDAAPSAITDYQVRGLVEKPHGLRPYEQSVFTAVASGTQDNLLSTLKTNFVAKIPLIKDQLHAEVTRAGLFESNPETTRKEYRNIGIVMLVISLLGFIAGVALFESVAELIFFPFMLMVPVAIGALVMSRFMPRRTRRGAIEATQWRAFARGLQAEGRDQSPAASGEADSARLQKYLPYAIALGVDKEWMQRFDRIGAPVPPWFDRNNSYSSGPIFIPMGYDTRSGDYIPSGASGSGPGWSNGGPFGGGATPQGASDAASGGIQSTSDFLVHVLNAASEALSHGGSSGGGWSSGSSGDSGGWSGGGGDSGGGGGGGGSGGFS